MVVTIDTDQKETGTLYIVSAPSGAGKTTLCRALLDKCAEMEYSVSYTTRKPRDGEVNGVDYYFISKEEFRKRIEDGMWAEWAEVHGNYYGTSAEFIDKKVLAGKEILLDIDVQGAVQIMKRYPESVSIFVMPPEPALDTLEERMKSRGTDSEEVILKRLVNAKKEMEKRDLYKHVIVNDDLSEAVRLLVDLVEKRGGV